jgi:hypothetical protein
MSTYMHSKEEGRGKHTGVSAAADDRAAGTVGLQRKVMGAALLVTTQLRFWTLVGVACEEMGIMQIMPVLIASGKPPETLPSLLVNN